MAESTTPATAIDPHTRFDANVPRITRNSLTKLFSPGRPMDASPTTRNAVAILGVTWAMPPIRPRSRVRVLSYSIPTSTNSRPVDSAWFTMYSTLPDIPCWVNANRPSTMNPTWEIDEYATSRFRSVCTIATTAPYTIPTSARIDT